MMGCGQRPEPEVALTEVPSGRETGHKDPGGLRGLRHCFSRAAPPAAAGVGRQSVGPRRGPATFPPLSVAPFFSSGILTPSLPPSTKAHRKEMDIPEIHGREGYEDEIDDDYEVDWSNSSSPTSGSGAPLADKEKSWLYTLDPILITIIAMSSLGVLLGATCAGLLLYCTCSYSGLSSRSCTTLENYNFELYDGLKHKVKMNHQKCCSEA
ncbi:hypothetical protein CB1_002756009 [Camelus ferus]|nr:hypothetical protein CB1_002756009 [Camelus ferus]